MKNGFIKVAAATPRIRIADPAYNTDRLIELAQKANDCGARVLVFPELCLSGSTCGDLFATNALILGCKQELDRYVTATAELDLISTVGVPLEILGKLYSCVAVVCGGKLLGVVPKTCLANGQGRHFACAPNENGWMDWQGEQIPFGTKLIFACQQMPLLRMAVELGEDAWASCPPSVGHTAAGAMLICNSAASNELVGAKEYRELMLRAHSTRTQSAYVFSSAGYGESTTDVVFGGSGLICENGVTLGRRKPFDPTCELLCTELDLERPAFDRRRSRMQTSSALGYQTVGFSLTPAVTPITCHADPHPFLPADREALCQRCDTILSIQANGLVQRIERAFAQKLVIGISGGLDSTLALLVAARALDLLGRPHTDILAVTMPCFGTTKRTKNTATVLCEELGTDFRCVDIFDAVNVHFRDIGHDPADRNVTYENSQARERTQILMDIANDCNGMVIGTGDLSELALGWATYNGDQMSMYGVNGNVPKTLVRHLVAYCANQEQADGKTTLANALRDVLDTPVSPELLPADENGEIAQKTEDLVGPYEIHDFYLYYMLRYGFSPEKLYRMAQAALGDTYSDEILKKWLKIFLRRFFSQQFKRSCLPDGPKVGSVGISPRGDWQMPSDASSALWLAEVDTLT